MNSKIRRIDYSGAWGTWSAGYHAPTLPMDRKAYEELLQLQAQRMAAIKRAATAGTVNR